MTERLSTKAGRGSVRLNQFNDKLRAFFPGSKWLSALPKVPSIRPRRARP